MEMSLVIVYTGIGLVAIALALLVLVLVPGRRRTAEVPDGAEVHPALGIVQQRPSLVRSLTTAAPAGYSEWVERQVLYAGRPAGWTVGSIVTWKIALLLFGVVAGALYVFAGGPQPLEVLLAVALTTLLFFLPDVLVNSRAHDRQEAMRRALPDVLDQMTIAVEAGLGFDAAMAKAARQGKGPLAEELIRVLQDMSIGRTRRDAFHELERRTSVDDLRRFVRAIVQADAYGVAIGEVLRVQAAEMRLKRRQRAEEQAQKVTVKILFPLVFCLLPVLFIVVMTPAVIGIVEAFSAAN
ncbi:tight adherence protein C [Agromyces sp. CF514]|uniref:type II secretion system F family protein n=1 Tax=Agromyces sp. CF514 TaxID=1881031 RepID=UPI0008DF6FCC|nr:type II secretion system F family protein [Agromyces sp. CF514]SFR69148.1 tight adherence protein C [Agromyces sp. CF514]